MTHKGAAISLGPRHCSLCGAVGHRRTTCGQAPAEGPGRSAQIVGCPNCEELIHLSPPIPEGVTCPRCRMEMVLAWIAVGMLKKTVTLGKGGW